METQRRRLRRLGDRDDHDRLVFFKLYPDDRGGREHLQAIKYGNHSRLTGTIEAIQMYSKMHRCVPKMRSKMAQQTRESRGEALAINRLPLDPLGLYALFCMTPAKIMLPP